MTVQPSATTTYIAASCNRASNVSDCRIKDGLLAFGSGRFVALWNSSVSIYTQDTQMES